MPSRQEKELIVAEDQLIKAAEVLDSWFKHMLKEGCFTLEDMSEPELEFMDAVKALRKAKRKK